MPRKHNLFLRVVSLFLAGAFSVSDISYSAAPPYEGLGLVGSPKPFELSQDPTRFEAPHNFSSLKEIYKGTSGPFIIHIQDAHSNLSGQQNLAETLDFIMSKYGVSLILVEGSSKEATLDPIKKIAPSKEILKRTAKSFLLQGKIAGEEYLNLVSDRPMKIMGIEDRPLYMKSIENYGLLADKRESVLLYLKAIQRSLEKLKQKLYPKELIAYESKSQDKGKGFESGFNELLSLAKASNIDLSNFPNIKKLMVLQEKEKKIDFNAANLEQAALIDEINQKGGKENLEGSLEKISQMKNSKISQFAFLQNILDIAREKNVSFSKYQNFMLYGEYLKGFSYIDLDQILDELTKAEDKAYASLLVTRDARLVRSIDRYIKLLNTAYNIQMSTKEFKLFEVNEPDFATVSYLAFINRKLTEFAYFDDLLPYKSLLEEGKAALADFYDSVDKRDMAFMQNTERIIKEESQKVAVLIAGGYHTPHLKELLRDKDYSYAVLTPVVTSETNQIKYEKLLLAPVRKEIKKLELVSGESSLGNKSLSALEKDLIRAKKTDGVKPFEVAMRAAQAISQDFAPAFSLLPTGPEATQAINDLEARPDNSIFQEPAAKEAEGQAREVYERALASLARFEGKKLMGARMAGLSASLGDDDPAQSQLLLDYQSLLKKYQESREASVKLGDDASNQAYQKALADLTAFEIENKILDPQTDAQPISLTAGLSNEDIGEYLDRLEAYQSWREALDQAKQTVAKEDSSLKADLAQAKRVAEWAKTTDDYAEQYTAAMGSYRVDPRRLARAKEAEGQAREVYERALASLARFEEKKLMGARMAIQFSQETYDYLITRAKAGDNEALSSFGQAFAYLAPAKKAEAYKILIEGAKAGNEEALASLGQAFTSFNSSQKAQSYNILMKEATAGNDGALRGLAQALASADETSRVEPRAGQGARLASTDQNITASFQSRPADEEKFEPIQDGVFDPSAFRMIVDEARQEIAPLLENVWFGDVLDELDNTNPYLSNELVRRAPSSPSFDEIIAAFGWNDNNAYYASILLPYVVNAVKTVARRSLTPAEVKKTTTLFKDFDKRNFKRIIELIKDENRRRRGYYRVLTDDPRDLRYTVHKTLSDSDWSLTFEQLIDQVTPGEANMLVQAAGIVALGGAIQNEPDDNTGKEYYLTPDGTKRYIYVDQGRRLDLLPAETLIEDIRAFERQRKPEASPEGQGARLAVGEEAYKFQVIFDVDLVTSSIKNAEDLEKLIGSVPVSLVARAFMVNPKAVAELVAFNFDQSNAAIRVEPAKDNSREALINFYVVNENGQEELIGHIRLTENALKSAKQANEEAREAITSEVVRQEVSPVLVAFGEGQRLLRLAVKALALGKPVILKVGLDRDNLLPEQMNTIMAEVQKVRSLLKEIEDINVAIQIVSKDGKTIYADLSDDTSRLENQEHEVMFVGVPNEAVLAKASETNTKTNKPSGFMSIQDIRQDAEGNYKVIPFTATLIAAIMVGRSDSLQGSDKLDVLLSSLIGIDFKMSTSKEDDFRAIKEVRSVDVNRYLKLAVKPIAKFDLNKFLEYTKIVIRAVGAAA